MDIFRWNNFPNFNSSESQTRKEKIEIKSKMVGPSVVSKRVTQRRGERLEIGGRRKFEPTCVFLISILRSSAYDIHVITARFLAATPVLRRRVTYRGNLRIDFVNCFPLGSFSEPITPVVALCFSSRRPFDIPRYSLSLSLKNFSRRILVELRC